MSGGIQNENPAYTYTLFVEGTQGDSVSVTGRLPQEWLVSVGSEWAGNAAGTTTNELSGNLGMVGKGVQTANTLGGTNAAFTALANRQWNGTKPLTWNLLAEFNAYDNAIDDVMRPVVLLQSMAMAKTSASLDVTDNASAGTLIGPAYWQTANQSGGLVGGKSMIMLRIGKMFVFDDIIVEDVNITKHMRLERNGLPIKAVAEIQLATRGPITFEQYVGFMTGSAMEGLFGKGDRIDAAKSLGPGQRAKYSGLSSVPPTK